MNKLRNLNDRLLLPLLLFLEFSIWIQWQAASMNHLTVKTIVIKQLFFCLMTVLVMLITSQISFRFWFKYAPLWYGLSLVPMVLLKWLYDPTMFWLTGTKRWLRIGPLSIQPSELVKITFVLVVVFYTLRWREAMPTGGKQSLKAEAIYLSKLFLLVLPTFLLMFLQKDFGTTLVFIWIILGLLIIVGVDRRILLTILIGGVGIGACLLLFVFTKWGQEILTLLHFKTYQLDRIRAWIDPFAYKDSIAFQQVRGIYAIASGGLAGKPASLGSIYVPVQESDMVFTVVGEHFGYLGSCLVLGLYLYLFYQMVVASLRTRQTNCLFVAVGLILALVFQVFENVGAAIGIVPLAGIPLPFLSQGGTSLVTIGFGFGLVLSMYHKNQRRRRFRSERL